MIFHNKFFLIFHKIFFQIRPGDVEIPMDSDDEEEKIQKLREARQKRLNQLKTAETEQSPSSSPQAQSPLG